MGKKCLAELAGTYLLVLLGCGVVHASVLTGAQSGLWQVAIVWGIDAHEQLNSRGSEPAAFLAELLGTLVLAMVVFAVTDRSNHRLGPLQQASEAVVRIPR